jgi:glycine/D-amino acid oxidase-like deaminating enzyme
VRAGHVVLAGNVHIGGLMPRLAGTLVPVSNYIAVTAPLGGKLRDVIGFRGVVSDTELVDNHYRVVGGDRLMWSGRLSIRQGKPRRYAKSLMADLARTYPQLGKVEAEYAWSGTLGVPVHRMPQVGEVSPGVWLLSGFAGHGLNTTAMGGEIIARAIVDGDQAWRLFLPFDLVWAGGAAARGGMQAFYRYHRTRERIQSWLARRRRGQQLPEIELDHAMPHAVEPDRMQADPPKKRTRRKARPRVSAPPAGT